MDKYTELTAILDKLDTLDMVLVNNVENVRTLYKNIEILMKNILIGIEVSDNEIQLNIKNLSNVISGKDFTCK